MDYNNYFKNHSGYNFGEEVNFKKNHIYIMNNFPILKKEIKNKNILDIGCGMGSFTKLCFDKYIHKYTGIDLDPSSIHDLKKIYKNYTFIHDDIINFFKNNKEKFDIIFMSHVYEHVSVEKAEILSKEIFNSLNEGGVWLNIMPNASFIFSNHLRYGDVTHKTLYTDNSFNQILLNSGFERQNIIHKNDIIGQGFISKIMLNIFRKGGYKLLQLLLFPQIKIFTPTIISIIGR